MKLTTSIPPRRDGVVNVEDGARKFVFKPDESGELTCDVEGDALIARLLATEMFAPARVEDYDAAEALLDAHEDAAGGAPARDDDDDINPDAPPLEAMTPPEPLKHAAKRAGKKHAT